MITSALWVCTCLVVAWTVRRRPELAILIALLIATSIPSVAHSMLESGLLPFAPTTVFIGSYVAINLLDTRDPRQRRTPDVVVAVGVAGLMLAFGALLSTYLATGTRRLPDVIDLMLAPVALYLVVVRAKWTDQRSLRVLQTGILTIATVQAIFAIAQWQTGRLLFFENSRTNFYWVRTLDFTRATGTLDSPLDLSLLLAIAVPLTMAIRNMLLRTLLLSLLATGILLTGSRSGMVALVAAVAIATVASKLSIAQRAMVAVAGVIAAAVVSRTGAAEGTLLRFETGRDSNEARRIARSYALDNIDGSAIIGRGAAASGGLRDQGVLSSSLESGWLGAAFDYGALFTLIFLVSLALLIVATAQAPSGRLPALSAAIAVTLVGGYSSISTRSAAAIILWTAVCLIAAVYISAEEDKSWTKDDSIPTVDRKGG